MSSLLRLTLRWVARLYPRTWRGRYGEEFAALMEELPEGRVGWVTLADVFRGALEMQFRRGVIGKAVAGGLAGLAIGGGVSLAIPDRYVTVALVRVASGVDDVTLAAGLKRSLEREELARFIEKHGLYGGEADAAQRMEQDVRVTLVQRSQDGSRGMRISYTHRVPETAQRVAGDIVAAVVKGQAGLVLRDAPGMPQTPVSPNRSLLLMLGVAAGVMTGVGAGLWQRKVQHL